MGQHRKHGRGWGCLAVSGLLVLIALLLQSRIDVPYQFVTAHQPFGAWYEVVRGMGAVPAARKQHVIIGGERVTLYAVDEMWESVYHVTLYEGRSITKRDVTQKTACIVLSESTARRLFPSGDALGQTVLVQGSPLDVVGLIRDGDPWGEADDAVALIPISLDVSMDTLCVSVPATADAASAAIWEKSLTDALPDGTFHNLRQMRWIAWMPFYVTLLFLLVWGASRSARTARNCAAHLWQKNRQALQTHYFGQVWMPVAARCVLIALMAAAFLAAAWGILLLCLQPLSAFPEYVPDNLVELSAWRQTVDVLLKEAASSPRYLTRESSGMETVRALSHAAYLFFALACTGSIRKFPASCDK